MIAEKDLANKTFIFSRNPYSSPVIFTRIVVRNSYSDNSKELHLF